MFRKTVAACIFTVLAISLATGADTRPPHAQLSAAEIVDRNVSARGGLQAWRAVQSLSMKGKMEAGGNNRPTLPLPGRKTGPHMPQQVRPTEQVQLPFVMELKRPRKVRVELQFNGQTAIQVFDGSNGWKLRPFLNRHEVEPYTAEELKATAVQADVDGPLVDYAAKGTKVEGALKDLAGVTSIAYTSGDPVAMAKALTKYAKDAPEFTFKVGVVEGRVITIKEIQALASMPSKEELYSKLLFLINAPAQRLVTVMNAVGRDVAVVISQGVEKGKFKGDAPAEAQA